MLTGFKALLAAAVVAAMMTGGCFSHSQDRKNAAARWDKMSSRMKLPLAQQQFDSGKYADAAKTISECLKADPNMPQALALAGKILFVQGQSDRSAAQLEKAVRLDEKLDDGWYWLGLISEDQGHVDKALECYRTALSLNGSNVEYTLADARASVALNKADEALALLRDKIRLFPSNVDLKSVCADIYCRQQNYDEAISLYRQAVIMAPKREDIAESFGYCCILAGQWTYASEVFGKLSTSSTDQSKKANYLQLLGMCQVNAGQYGNAITSYSKLSTGDRENAQTWLRMAQAAIGAGDGHRAYACSMRALAIQPGSKDAIAVKGSAEYMNKNYKEAIATFEQIAGEPEYKSFAWMMLAKCYEHTGETEKAEQAAKKAHALDNGSRSPELSAKISK